MSATEPQEGDQQRGGRLLTVVFWVGVGLAPLAALILLIGRGEGSLKIAAALALVAVVLIGLSIALRPDVDSVRAELEDTILDEVDALREDLRHDIATAARATHRQFSEKLQYLHESVEALRAQVEAMRMGYEHVDPRAAGVGGPPPGPAHPPHHMQPPHVGAPGVVRHTETVQVTTRHTIVDPHAEGQGRGAGTVYGAAARAEAPPPRRSEGWHDPHEERGGRHNGRPAEPAPSRQRYAPPELPPPAEESWTEQRLRERLAEARAERAHGGGGGGGLAPRWSEQRGAEVRRSRYDDDDPGEDERWSGMRAGDRWATVRTDDRGRELRIGERRAAMHTDETGTEMRFEDRWTSVRRDEPRRRDESTSRWADERWEDDGGGEHSSSSWDFRADREDPEGRWERRGGQRALPAASSDRGWADDRGWEGEGRGGGGHRRAPDWEAEPEDPPPPPPRSRGARRLDFELSDDRWR